MSHLYSYLKLCIIFPDDTISADETSQFVLQNFLAVPFKYSKGFMSTWQPLLQRAANQQSLVTLPYGLEYW